jgi:hypothetical protein
MQRVLQYPAILILRFCVLRLLKARSMEQNNLEFHPGACDTSGYWELEAQACGVSQ